MEKTVMNDWQYIIVCPQNAKQTIILAHGAGAGMDTPFMETMATGPAEQGLKVIRFEFPFMREKERTQPRKSAAANVAGRHPGVRCRRINHRGEVHGRAHRKQGGG